MSDTSSGWDSEQKWIETGNAALNKTVHGGGQRYAVSKVVEILPPSNHSQVAHVVLREKGGSGRRRTEEAAIKRYFGLVHSPSTMASAWFDPARMWRGETLTLAGISKAVRADLVPRLYGKDDAILSAVIGWFKGDNYAKIIIGEERGSPREYRHLCGLVDTVAYIVGNCTAKREEILGGRDTDIRLLQEVQRELLQSNLALLTYKAHPECFKDVDYTEDRVEEFLRQRGVQLDTRVRELWEAGAVLRTREVFAHNDLNPAHVFPRGRGKGPGRVIDLETAGPGDLVGDLAAALTIYELGCDRILGNQEYFPPLLKRFLLLEKAYEDQEMDRAEFIKRKEREYFRGRDVTDRIMAREEYAAAEVTTQAIAAIKYLQLASRAGASQDPVRDVRSLAGRVLKNKTTMGKLGSEIKDATRTFFRGTLGLLDDIGYNDNGDSYRMFSVASK